MTQLDAFNLDELTERRVSRRAVLKFAGAAAGTLGLTGLLAACGGDDDDDDDDTGTTTTGAQPTATTAAGQPTAAGTTPAETTAPSGETPAAEGQPGGELILGFGIQQLQDLDPAQVALGIIAGELVPNLFSSLVQFDESLSVVPDLAESWEVSDDGTEYVFHLREGLTFHNGDTLTAEDLVYTAARTVDPALASAHANKLANVTESEAVDPLTYRLVLSEPFGPFLATACSRGPGRALTPIPKRAIDEMGNDQFNITPVGCGPFMMVPETMDVGTGFEMVAFEDWYAGRPFLDKIIVRLIPEPSSRISALAAGDVDMLDIVPATGVAQLEGNDQIELVQSPGTNWIGLQINLTRPPLDNLDVRMAISKAIDRQALVDTALFGLAALGIGPTAPAFLWAYVPPEEWGENPQAFDLDAAKELAESAGLSGTELTILAGADDTRREEVLRGQLNEIGVTLQIDPVQNVVETERWQAGDYDIYLSGSNVDADPDDNWFNFFITDGPWNTNGWTNAECDRMLAATRATANQEERRDLFHELQRLVQQEAPMPFLYHLHDTTGFRTFVKGYKAIPEMRYLESVWLDK